MHRSFHLRSVLVLAVTGLGLAPVTVDSLAAPPGNEAPVFVEVAGEMEFSGRLIARPTQMEDWLESGLTQRAADRRVNRARAFLQRFQLYRYVGQTDETIILVPGGRTEDAVARELLDTGLFQYVEPDWIVYPLQCSNDPLLASQWHHAANIMESCAAWDLHTGDPTTAVGICDTGLRTTHEDFQQHRLEGYNAVDFLWESDGGNIGDIHGHGTATTGCAAANGDNSIGISGVGWDLSHRILKVSNSQGGSSSISTLTHAAQTAVENGDRVASVSYSGVNSAAVRTSGTYIKSIGGLLVWAAGNSNQNLTDNDRDADDVIVVGATDSGDNKASFSNYGIYVDLCAPGVDVFTTSNSGNAGYGGASGTSFSCPLTAGLAALIWSANPALSPDEVEIILKQSCEDLGDAGIDNIHGYGRINSLNAMMLAQVNLNFNYPNGLPQVVDPSGGTTVRVEVSSGGADPQPGTGMLHVDWGVGWNSYVMEEIIDNVYDGVFPATPCGSTVEFYFTAETTDGVTVSDPASAPNGAVYTTQSAGGVGVVFEDNFETNQGWTVQNIQITGGAWQRGVPAGDGSRGDPTQDFDGSGSCYLTQNGAGNTDVDGGPTRLISPVFDLSSGGEATLSYARWFYNDDGDIDRLNVEISNDDGNTWTLIESVADAATGGWNEMSVRVADFVTPTSTMRVRFSATDNPNDSVTEAAIDAVRVESIACNEDDTIIVAWTRIFGMHLGGDLAELTDSDDTFLVLRSVPGFTATEPNIAEIQTDHVTTVSSPVEVDVTIESRLNSPNGAVRVFLKDFPGGGVFELVRTYPLGTQEHVETFLAGPEYVNTANGLVQTRIRASMLATFSVFGFEEFIDQVLVDVN